MIEFLKLDLCEVTKGIVAHGVNCQGAMGSGVAGALRKKYPQIFDSYKNLVDSYDMKSKLLGRFDLVEINPSLFIANCFTQEFYGSDGKVYARRLAIYTSLKSILELDKGLPLYIPRIGCGLGGLKWKYDVEPHIAELSKQFPNTTIYVCDL